MADLSSTPTAAGTASKPKTPINLHDWAIWRMQLNEQMSATMSEQRADLRPMRQYLQSNAFYQQHCRDPTSGQYAGARLLFAIPHAKLKPEFLEGSMMNMAKSVHHELADLPAYEQQHIQSNSDERTATSVNSMSAAAAAQPMIFDRGLSQLLAKGSSANAGCFLQVNDQFSAPDGMRTR